jgi:hypothetical protein
VFRNRRRREDRLYIRVRREGSGRPLSKAKSKSPNRGARGGRDKLLFRSRERVKPLASSDSLAKPHPSQRESELPSSLRVISSIAQVVYLPRCTGYGVLVLRSCILPMIVGLESSVVRQGQVNSGIAQIQRSCSDHRSRISIDWRRKICEQKPANNPGPCELASNR